MRFPIGLIAMLAMLGGCNSGDKADDGGPADIRATVISNFKRGSQETQFGDRKSVV